MHKRVCPHCNTEVTHKDYDVAFSCQSCLNSIHISESNQKTALEVLDKDEGSQNSSTLPTSENVNAIWDVMRGLKNPADISDQEEPPHPKAPDKKESYTENVVEEDVHSTTPPLEHSNGSKKLPRKALILGVALLTLASATICISIKNLYTKGSEKLNSKLQSLDEQKNTAQDKDDIYHIMSDGDASKKFLREYLECETVEEAKTFILPDASIAPVLEQYWTPRSYDEITELKHLRHVVRNTQSAAHIYNCSDGDEPDRSYAVYYIKELGKRFIDWRIAEQIEDLPIDDLLSRPAGKYKVRVTLVQEDYYDASYPKKDWISFSCYSLNDTKVRCYLKKSNKAAKSLAKIIKSQSGRNIFKDPEKSSSFLETASLEDPATIYELRQRKGFNPYLPHASAIIELDVKDPAEERIELVGLVCETSAEYYKFFQLPFLLKHTKLSENKTVFE